MVVESTKITTKTTILTESEERKQIIIINK
jgi:hypothetical protein